MCVYVCVHTHLCVCFVRACMRVYMCTCLYVCICMYVHVRACARMCVYIILHMYVHTCLYVCVYMCVCMCLCVSFSVCLPMCMLTRACVHSVCVHYNTTYSTIFSDEPKCAELLVQHGADINSRNSKGASPVMIAATKGCNEMLHLLTQQQALRLADQVYIKTHKNLHTYICTYLCVCVFLYHFCNAYW